MTIDCSAEPVCVCPGVSRDAELRRADGRDRSGSGWCTPRSRPASTSSTPPTSYHGGQSEVLAGAGARRSPGPRRARDQGALSRLGEGPERGRQLAAAHPARLRRVAPPPRHRLDRPVPGPPPEPRDADRRDAWRADRPGARREGALHRLLDPSGLDGDGGPRDRRAAGLARYVSEQPPYNLLDRRVENELVPLARRYDLALLPWAPLAQGVLAGRYSVGRRAAGRLARRPAARTASTRSG